MKSYHDIVGDGGSRVLEQVAEQRARITDGLAGVRGVHEVSQDGPRIRFSVDQAELNRVLAHLVERNVRTLVSSPPTLEELFLQHYEPVPA